MIRHVVVFRLTLEATPERKRRMAEELARLPSLVPSIRAFRAGPDVGINDGNFDFGVVADFDDADGYVAYRDHPEHRKIVEEFIRPIRGQRAAIQFEF